MFLDDVLIFRATVLQKKQIKAIIKKDKRVRGDYSYKDESDFLRGAVSRQIKMDSERLKL